MTAALEGGEWSAERPCRTLPPGKTRYPFYRRLGGPQGWSERAENLVPTGIRSRTVHPVVSHYTDSEHNVYCYIHSRYHPFIPLCVPKNVCLMVGGHLKNTVLFTCKIYDFLLIIYNHVCTAVLCVLLYYVCTAVLCVLLFLL